MYPLSQTVEIHIKGADKYSPVIGMDCVQGYKMPTIIGHVNLSHRLLQLRTPHAILVFCSRAGHGVDNSPSSHSRPPLDSGGYQEEGKG